MYRFVPSLREAFSLNGLRVALCNYIAAKERGEPFWLIFDDSDADAIEAGDQEITALLGRFGIEHDRRLYRSENLKFYRQMATKLLMDGKAFTCFCTPQRLADKREAAKREGIPYRYDGACRRLSDMEVLDNESPFVIRIKKPDSAITLDRMVGDRVEVAPDEIDDFVIMDRRKFATAVFADAIDDMMYDLSTLILDESDRQRSAEEVVIHRALGYEKRIRFLHLPAIVAGKGDQSIPTVRELLEAGYLPSAIVNYLLLPALDSPEEICTLEEAIGRFDLTRLSETAPIFDPERLREINRKHMRRTDAKSLSAMIGYSSADIGEIARIFARHESTLQEIKAKVDKIFAQKRCDQNAGSLAKLKNIAKNAPYFQEFEDFETYLSQESGLSKEALCDAMRILVTGESEGPDIADLYPHIRNYLGEILK